MSIFCWQCEIRFPRSFETAMMHRERARARGWKIEVRKNRCTCPQCAAHQISVELRSNPTARRKAELLKQLDSLGLRIWGRHFAKSASA